MDINIRKDKVKHKGRRRPEGALEIKVKEKIKIKRIMDYDEHCIRFYRKT